MAYENVAGKFYPAVFMDTREVGVKVTARFDPETWDFQPDTSPWVADGSSNRHGSERSDDGSQAESSSPIHSQAESDDD